MENSVRPIIIIKKKAGHGGHHGGAWKVAYADFVTAMMALFIVLWLLNTSKPVREAIAGYFRDPSGTANKMGSKNVGAGENFTITKDNVSDLMEKLQKTIQQMPDFDKLQHQIEMTITSEGLRIEMMETETGTFFDVGSPRPNGNGKELLVLLAQELGKVPNRISIEGRRIAGFPSSCSTSTKMSNSQKMQKREKEKAQMPLPNSVDDLSAQAKPSTGDICFQ